MEKKEFSSATAVGFFQKARAASKTNESDIGRGSRKLVYDGKIKA